MVDSPLGSPAIGSSPLTGKGVVSNGVTGNPPMPPSLLKSVPEKEAAVTGVAVLTSSPSAGALDEDDLQEEEDDVDAEESADEQIEESTEPVGDTAAAASLVRPSTAETDPGLEADINANRERAYQEIDATQPKSRWAPPALVAITKKPTRPSMDTVDNTSPQRSRDAPQGPRGVPAGLAPDEVLPSQPVGVSQQSQQNQPGQLQQQQQQHSVPFPTGSSNGPSTSSPASSNNNSAPPNDLRIEYKSAKLIPEDLAPPNNTNVAIKVEGSTIKSNDRGKEVLSFIISVAVKPSAGREGQAREPWKVEKLYSDVLSLDARVRGNAGKSLGKKVASLPDSKLFKDNAPAKVDLRKVRQSFPLSSVWGMILKS